jgi:hypothetical protein
VNLVKCWQVYGINACDMLLKFTIDQTSGRMSVRKSGVARESDNQFRAGAPFSSKSGAGELLLPLRSELCNWRVQKFQ